MTTNAGDAASQLKSLAGAVGKVQKAASPLSAALQNTIKNATKYEVLVHKAAVAEMQMNKAFAAGDEQTAWAAREKAISAQAQAIKELERSSSSTVFERIASAARRVSDGFKNIFANGKRAFGAIKSVGNSAKSSSGFLSGLFNSIKRIAVYRLLRTAIKELTQAFNEGLTNAYNFSRGISGTLANAMDGLASSSLKMKNQLGAAFGNLLQIVTPILLQIIDLVTRAASAISALLSAFGGGQYLVANDVAASWDKATGAAKKYRNTILGFDEINRLDEPSGGGGGSTVDASNMFHVEELPGWAQKIKDAFGAGKFKEIGAEIANGINNAIASVSFGEAGSNLVKFFTNAIDFLIGFIRKFNWAQFGKAISDFLIGAFNQARGWLESGNFGELVDGLFSAIDGVISAVDWQELGDAAWGFFNAAFTEAGKVLRIVFDKVDIDESGNISAEDITNQIKDKILPVAGAILGWRAGGFGGALVGLLLGVGIKMAFDKGILTEGKIDWKGIIDSILDSKVLPVAGAIAGWKLTHSASGIVVGLALGTAINFTIKDYLGADGQLDQDAILMSICKNVIPIAFGAVFGAAVGGAPGALIGMTIGVALTFVVNSTSWKGGWDMVGKAQQRMNAELYGVQMYAGGGAIENNGTLFLAGESGAEIVANMGSHTGVMNVGQMEAAVANGNDKVVSAVYSMASAIVTAINNKDSDISIDGESVARLMYRPMQMENKRRGQSFVSGGAFA